jgi:hypothetical protein
MTPRMQTVLAMAVLILPGLRAGAGAAERLRPQVQGEKLLPCPKQGAGFVRVPGSPTSNGAAPVTAGQLSIDTRSESEFGPVRAFVRMGHGRP